MHNMSIRQKILSLFMVIVIVGGTFSALPIISSAAPALPAANTETRHAQTCTSLSSDALAYYTGSYTYANLSSLSGASNVSTSAAAMQNNALYSALQTLMTNTHTFKTSYSGTGEGSLAYYWQRTDAQAGNAGSFVLVYCDNVVSINSSSSFNREHVWPKSNASFTESNGGSDLHHLRPADPNINSTRGNLPFGNVRSNGGSYTTGSCYWKTSSYFEPKDNVKGDLARILLYVYTRWGENNIYSDTSNGGKIIESLDTLLEWMALDPVDTWEMKRNDLTQDVQGNRNVFIDYPELAWKMFGRTMPAGTATPSGGTSCTHNWTLTSQTAATCTASGTTVYTCTLCNAQRTETAAALGHTDANGDSVCDRCGLSLASTSSSFTLVSSASEVTAGNYVITWDNSLYLPSETAMSKPSVGTGITVADNALTNTVTGNMIWTFTGNNTNGFTVSHTSGSTTYYLTATNASTGVSVTTSATGVTWKASVDSSKGMLLKGSDEGSRYLAVYSSTDWRYYATSNYNGTLRLYKESAGAHTHSYGEWTVTTPATCTADGVETRTCSCGASETRTIAATGHTAVNDAAIAPTCTETGLTAGSHCSVCGAVLTAQTTVAATGHSYAEYSRTDATCTAAGTIVYRCANCNDTYNESIAALGHDYDAGVITTQPTETTTGVKTYTCSRCNGTKTEVIPATGGSADYSLGAYDGAILDKKDGQNTVTFIGTVSSDIARDADSIGYTLTFSQNGTVVKEIVSSVSKVYTTIIDCASVNEITAGTQGIDYIENADYIFGITVKGIPDGYYTVNFSINATANGSTIGDPTAQTISFYVNPTAEQQTVLDLYELSAGATTDETVTLTGVVTGVTEINTTYGNATFTMVVGGLTEKPITCYRVFPDTGIDLNDLQTNATVTVTGYVKNYNGTIEFCTANSVQAKITSIVEPQYTDAQKLEIERSALTINPVDGASVPSTGSRYNEVAITWSSSNSAVVSVVNGVITVDNSTLTQATDVTLTATLSLNGASVTKTFTVAVSAPSSNTESKTWSLYFPDGNSGANTNYTGTWTATIDNQTWTLFAINNGGDSSSGWTAVRAGRKNTASVATITTTIDGTVENVVLSFTQVNAAKTNSIKLYVKNGSTTVATINIDSVSAGDHTFTIPAAAQGAGLTYEFELDLQADTANGNWRIDEITYNGFVTTGTQQPTVSDDDKVQAEYSALDITPVENGTALPAAGTTYTDVEITWASDDAAVSVAGNVVSIINPLQAGDDDLDVTLTATISCGASELEKEFVVTITAPTGGNTPVAASWALTFPSYNDNSVGSYTATWTATVSGQVWTLANFNNNNNGWSYVKCGGKGKSGDATISTTVAGTVTEFVVSASKMGYATGLTLTVKNGGTTLTTITGSTDAGDQTISIPAQYQGEGYTYTLTFSYNNTSSSNGSIWVESVTANGYEAA